jgi:D-amino-acid oxidase
MQVRVVGAGIIGLTTALRCAEAGHTVEIVAAEFGDETTSAVAAALWYPYRALPQHAVTRWARIGFDVLSDISRDVSAGVDMRSGRQLFDRRTPDPWWIEAVPQLVRADPAALPTGYHDGIELTVPVVDMPVHLGWLADRLQSARVALVRQRVVSLDEARRGVDVVVNCAGLGARTLADDDELHPVRGQVVLLAQIGLDRWTLDETDARNLTYVLPRRATIVVGGTALDRDEDLDVRPDTAEQIMRRATALVPELARAEVLGHRVGLRPARSGVRLERDGDVVHCYGHGGAGVTLAYGCAQDVVALLS